MLHEDEGSHVSAAITSRFCILTQPLAMHSDLSQRTESTLDPHLPMFFIAAEEELCIRTRVLTARCILCF